MNNIKKRETWDDNEIKDMLMLIKNKYAEKLFDSKIKRNQNIYEQLSKELYSKGIKKSAGQIRTKFKFLKADFKKYKQNNAEKPASRQTRTQFDIMNEVYGKRLETTVHDTETTVHGTKTYDNSDVEDNEYELKKEISELLDPYTGYKSKDVESYEIFNAAENTNPTPTNYDNEKNSENVESDPLEAIPKSTINYNTLQAETNSDEEINHPPSKRLRTFKQSKVNSYVKVVQSFTKEWRNTQENMLQQMKEQDKQYMLCLQDMLEVNRKETAKILEADRKETQHMLTSIISMMQPQSHRAWQPQLNISRPVVNFSINNITPKSKLPQNDIDTTVD